MEALPLKWYKIAIDSNDSFLDITEKLEKKNIDSALFPNSVYVIRIAKGFIIEYPKKKLSPVIYIGQGKLRGRFFAHRKWLGKFSSLLHGVQLEASFCFPRSPEGSRLNKQLEAHLINRFEQVHGRKPLNNKKREPLDPDFTHSAKLDGQVFGNGIGKKYPWAISPRNGNPFLERGTKNDA